MTNVLCNKLRFNTELKFLLLNPVNLSLETQLSSLSNHRVYCCFLNGSQIHFPKHWTRYFSSIFPKCEFSNQLGVCLGVCLEFNYLWISWSFLFCPCVSTSPQLKEKLDISQQTRHSFKMAVKWDKTLKHCAVMLFMGFVINTVGSHKAPLVPNGVSQKFCHTTLCSITLTSDTCTSLSMFVQIYWIICQHMHKFLVKMCFCMDSKLSNFFILRYLPDFGVCSCTFSRKIPIHQGRQAYINIHFKPTNKIYFETNSDNVCFWCGHTFVFMLSVWVWH